MVIYFREGVFYTDNKDVMKLVQDAEVKEKKITTLYRRLFGEEKTASSVTPIVNEHTPEEIADALCVLHFIILSNPDVKVDMDKIRREIETSREQLFKIASKKDSDINKALTICLFTNKATTAMVQLGL